MEGSIVATSRYYDAVNVLQFLLPLALLCVALLFFGGYLVIHSALKIRRIDRLIHRIKLEHSAIAQFLEPSE
jgi:type II secretory pathway component PulF